MTLLYIMPVTKCIILIFTYTFNRFHNCVPWNKNSQRLMLGTGSSSSKVLNWRMEVVNLLQGKYI
jgi:hypothetical protein